MNCPKCKNPIEDNAAVCEWCGAEITKNKTPNNTNLQYIYRWLYIICSLCIMFLVLMERAIDFAQPNYFYYRHIITIMLQSIIPIIIT